MGMSAFSEGEEIFVGGEYPDAAPTIIRTIASGKVSRHFPV
jgi:hypothetical protein